MGKERDGGEGVGEALAAGVYRLVAAGGQRDIICSIHLLGRARGAHVTIAITINRPLHPLYTFLT